MGLSPDATLYGIQMQISKLGFRVSMSSGNHFFSASTVIGRMCWPALLSHGSLGEISWRFSCSFPNMPLRLAISWPILELPFWPVKNPNLWTCFGVMHTWEREKAQAWVKLCSSQHCKCRLLVMWIRMDLPAEKIPPCWVHPCGANALRCAEWSTCRVRGSQQTALKSTCSSHPLRSRHPAMKMLSARARLRRTPRRAADAPF